MAEVSLEHGKHMTLCWDDKIDRLATIEITEANAKIKALHKKHQEAMMAVGQSKLLLEQAKDNKKRRVRGGDKGRYLYE